jgi:uncharacterized protein (TIGR02391 family)
MRRALPKLQRRLDEVNAIDSTQATSPFTPEFASVNENVNATLIEIFGAGSLDFDRYKSSSIYAGPLRYGRDTPRHEVIRGYEEGKKRVLIKLDAAIKFINEKLAEVSSPTESNTPRSLAGVDLHPAIEQAAGQLFRDGHYANAVENACKALNNLVQMKSENYELDYTKLMSFIFSKNAPTLVFNELISQSDRDEQEGFMHLYVGVCLAFRNPRAHELTQDEPDIAFGMIVTVSFLARMLDHATVRSEVNHGT